MFTFGKCKSAVPDGEGVSSHMISLNLLPNDRNSFIKLTKKEVYVMCLALIEEFNPITSISRIYKAMERTALNRFTCRTENNLQSTNSLLHYMDFFLAEILQLALPTAPSCQGF